MICTTIQTVQFEVPLGFKWTGDIRPARKGERFIRDSCSLATWHDSRPSFGSYPIVVEETWEAPEWIPDGAWVYRGDATGDWWVTTHGQPTPGPLGRGFRGSGTGIRARQLARYYGGTFTPPKGECVQVKRSQRA